MIEPTRFSLSRRAALFAASSLVVTACSNTIDSIGESISAVASGIDSEPINRAKVDSIPYASMSAKIGKGPRSIIVLGRINEEDFHWISGDQVALVTRQGRLTQTAGLPANLKRSEFLDEDPIASIGTQKIPPDSATFRRLIDFEAPDRFGIMVGSQFQVVGPETIVIAELAFDTLHIQEHCRVREFDWTFQNDYWVDPEHGLLWKSVQYFHPDFPAIELQLLKPPSA